MSSRALQRAHLNERLAQPLPGILLNDQGLRDILLRNEATMNQERAERLRAGRRARPVNDPGFGRVNGDGDRASIAIALRHLVLLGAVGGPSGSLLASQFHLTPSVYGGACVNVNMAGDMV